jgi:Domain of unknown function (DUF6249)
MESLTGFVSAVLFWVVLAGIILVPIYLRYQDRQRMHETLRIALEKGQPMPPELIAALQSNIIPRRPTTPESDLRRAVILIAVGLGFCGLGYGLWYGLMSVNDIAAYTTGGSVAGLGAIPGLVGIAHLVLWATRRGAPKA